MVEATDLGRAVLAGGVDADALRGHDRCIGGVHLASGEGTPGWRWDAEARTVRSAP